MTLSQSPKGPWGGLKQLPRRRRLPRSNLYLTNGPDLRERMAVSRFDIVSACLFSLVLFVAGLLWVSNGETIWAKALDAAGLPLIYLFVDGALWLSKALPFFHRSVAARTLLVGLPALLIGVVVMLAISLNFG